MELVDIRRGGPGGGAPRTPPRRSGQQRRPKAVDWPGLEGAQLLAGGSGGQSPPSLTPSGTGSPRGSEGRTSFDGSSEGGRYRGTRYRPTERDPSTRVWRPVVEGLAPTERPENEWRFTANWTDLRELCFGVFLARLKVKTSL